MSTPSALVPLLVPLATKDWLGPVATVISAVIAVIGVLATRVQAKRSADAAHISAAASYRSSKASERSVEVNERIADQVGERAVADAFAKRYGGAANQLGHGKAAVRLAGVYAMARLADDWEEQRPQCVDVLCAYLRMPIWHETEGGAAGERQVRQTVLDLLGRHLKVEHPANWCDCEIDLADAEIESLCWREATFNKTPNFSRAKFQGMVSIAEPTFSNGVYFYDTQFDDQFLLQSARVLDGQIMLMRSKINGGVVTTSALAKDAAINLSGAVISGQFGVTVAPQPEQPGVVALHETKVADGGHLYLDTVGIPDWDDSHRCAAIFPRAVVRPSLKDFGQPYAAPRSGDIWVYKPEG